MLPKLRLLVFQNYIIACTNPTTSAPLSGEKFNTVKYPITLNCEFLQCLSFCHSLSVGVTGMYHERGLRTLCLTNLTKKTIIYIWWNFFHRLYLPVFDVHNVSLTCNNPIP